jgi:WD40 repeat protein
MRVQQCGLIDYPSNFIFQCLLIFLCLAGQIFSVDFHPSGKFLATCGNDGKGKGLVTIWDTAFLNYEPEASEGSSSLEFNFSCAFRGRHCSRRSN